MYGLGRCYGRDKIWVRVSVRFVIRVRAMLRYG